MKETKKLLLLLVTLCTLGFSVTSCKKDDKTEEQVEGKVENHITWGDKTIKNMAYTVYSQQSNGYSFELSLNTPKDNIWNESEYLYLDVPKELMGEKIDLNSDYSFNWTPYGEFKMDDKDYWWENKEWGGNDSNSDFSGTDSWMKVTKEGEDNFTIEVNATIDGKLLKVYCKGKFVKQEA
ncbi:hypothetical protein [Pseudopedobacter beijingensis]|uniref:Uncharacterized protein n=1 Tax=Pseudopedobacter beijingensis TaxID=1207056 RepID=A0ABW4IG83_9SPHI